MKLTQLIPGQRYLFHYKSKQPDDINNFRANFIGFIKHGKIITIQVNDYEPQDLMYGSNKTIWSIDTDKLSKVESLSEIMYYTSKLNDDVLNIIDTFI